VYEPFGLSVLEAAFGGCALVLSDIPTHREMWGGAAIFVAARDDAAFASALQDLLDDPDERQVLGQLARARAQLYTPERMARGMAEIYARVAQRSPAEQAIAGAA
jgi:glycosyltransferase involved in cell wall biosynthesis